jgi:hypothetical protein
MPVDPSINTAKDGANHTTVKTPISSAASFEMRITVLVDHSSVKEVADVPANPNRVALHTITNSVGSHTKFVG